MITDPLRFAARHARYVLVAGLVVGLAAPGLAEVMRPWLPHLVVALLFVSVLRMAPRAILGALPALPRVAGTALALQLAAPLVILGLASLLGQASHPVALALILMTAAPSIVGSPNITALLGAAPEYAMRLMVVGTLLMPFTILPVFALAPALDGAGAVTQASLVLVATIGVTALCAMATRRLVFRTPAPATVERLDGLSALALAVFVVALMPQVSALALADPMALLGWAALAFAANLGAQFTLWRATRHRLPHDTALPLSLIAGNRNVALFLVSLPAETTAPVMAFIGCYQLPMYLTPILMRGVYRR
ncbi:hypothetical protein [Cognatishimia sp. F0-27]|uniref:hypothetical protein n=1 Tax=Cognatishimia sp. F0-27 TaxID=2816855 RepID=UPI001D0C4A06|nr:hypothetical protein [Cognatishimia sp. F0-27]MCC1495072.1 hypothetical protein [Cognatishimia sp. F0-27]